MSLKSGTKKLLSTSRALRSLKTSMEGMSMRQDIARNFKKARKRFGSKVARERFK